MVDFSCINCRFLTWKVIFAECEQWHKEKLIVHHPFLRQ